MEPILFRRYIMYLLLYLTLLTISAAVVFGALVLYWANRLVFNGVIENIEQLPALLEKVNILALLTKAELWGLLIFCLLFLFLRILATKKALQKTFFKEYKNISITSKLKRISWTKSIIFCTCEVFISNLITKIVTLNAPQTFMSIGKLIAVYSMAWLITEYFLILLFCRRYLIVR